MSGVYDAERVRQRVRQLVREVEDGKYTKDILPNASYDMTGERQSAYFAHARENMKTDIAWSIMHRNQDLADVRLMEAWRGL